jgi:hypothetical protein
MDKKDALISDILHSIKFDYIDRWINTLKLNSLINPPACSREEWDNLLSLYKIKPYEVAKRAFALAEKNETSKVSLESLKAEIYDIGKNRNPSAKHIRALLEIIMEKNSSKFVITLKANLELKKIFALTEFLKRFTNEDNIVLYSKEQVSNILPSLDIKDIQELHDTFTTDKWIYNDSDCDYSDDVCIYLEEKMDKTNLSFLYHNVECLYTYYNEIGFILKELVYADTVRLENEYENLKRKRIYSRPIGKCFSALNTLNYEAPSKPVTKEMINEIEQYLPDFPNMESLIFYIGKLTPLKWNFLLLLIRNYKYPAGKKVRKWLAKVQYDIV